MMSEIVWEKYRQGTGFSEPFVIHFPDYSKGMWVSCISTGLDKQKISAKKLDFRYTLFTDFFLMLAFSLTTLYLLESSVDNLC